MEVTVTAVGTGVADTLLVHIALPGEVKWRVPLWSAPLLGGPAQGPDGTLYVLGDLHLNEDTAMLFAVTPQGTIKWSRRLGSVKGSNYPVVDVDGTVYVVGQWVWAFNPDGSLRWSLTSRPIEDPPQTSAFLSGAVSANGILYAAMGLDLFAFRASNGDTLWQGPRSPIGGWLLPPSLSADGNTAYIKSSADSLFAFRTSDHTIRWGLPDPLPGQAAFGVGSVLFGDRVVVPAAAYLQEVDATGNVLGLSANVGRGVSEPVVATDGTRFVQVTPSNGLKAFGPGASLKWEVLGYRSRWTWYGGPALATGGILYAASLHGFYSLQTTATGVTVRWKYPSAAGQELVFVGAPLIGPDGTVYTFSSCDFGRESAPCTDELFAFWEDKPVEPNSPWPMWRHDARRSGQADR